METQFIYRRLLPVVLAVIFLLYLVQGFSPLRINTDSVAYLHMARSAWLGQGFNIPGAYSYFPKGYSAILSVLHYAGIATPFMFVFLNTIFLFSGAFIFYCLFRKTYHMRGTEGLILVLLITLSYVSLKHTVITVSETAFFFVSSAALLSLQISRDKKRQQWVMLLVSLSLAAAAFWIRTIGVAILPAILFSVLMPKIRSNSFQFLKDYQTYYGLTLIGLISGLTLYVLVHYTTYDHIVSGLIRTSVSESNLAGAAILHLNWKLNEIAQIVLNVPPSILPSGLKVPFLICGGLVVFFVIQGFFTQLRTLSYLDVYFIGYSLIVLSWHYHDARFWLPIIPFLLLFFFLGIRNYNHIYFLNFSKRMWLVVYILLGGIALTHSTYLTFSGKQFGERYGDGALREIYREAFFGTEVADKTKFQKQQLALLQWYEPLAKKR